MNSPPQSDAFTVSVVIPAYNVERYIEQAVCSALAQPETGEILLIEDASEDATYTICKSLETHHDRVRLLTHANHQNLGAGASRNLGITEARCPFIAFLDGDDFMLEHRFQQARQQFSKHPHADAVYEAVRVEFESQQAREQWYALGHKPEEELCTTDRPLDCGPDYGKHGLGAYIHTNGWTIRKQFFTTTGLFNPALRLHQDADLFIRFQIAGQLLPGSLQQPVACYRIHDANRITRVRPPKEILKAAAHCRLSTWRWARKAGYPGAAQVVSDDLFRLLSTHSDQYRHSVWRALWWLYSDHPHLLLSPCIQYSLGRFFIAKTRVRLGRLRRQFTQ